MDEQKIEEINNHLKEIFPEAKPIPITDTEPKKLVVECREKLEFTVYARYYGPMYRELYQICACRFSG